MTGVSSTETKGIFFSEKFHQINCKMGVVFCYSKHYIHDTCITTGLSNCIIIIRYDFMGKLLLMA